MKKHIALALSAAMSLPAAFAATLPAWADDCRQQVVCPVVPGTNYHGSSDVRPTIRVTVCFTEREYGIITRPDGTNEWVVHLRYKSGSYERIATMRNAQCRDQFVTSGTRMAVYVTCPEYTGWVSTQPIVASGQYTMERVGGQGWSYVPI